MFQLDLLINPYSQFFYYQKPQVILPYTYLTDVPIAVGQLNGEVDEDIA